MHSRKLFIVMVYAAVGLLLVVLLGSCGGASNLSSDQVLGKSTMKKPDKPPPEQGDNTPPAAVTDLAVGSTNFYSIGLDWTATGDDGTEGQASYYEFRYSTAPITADNWDAAKGTSYEPEPAPAGADETFTLYSVLRNTTYYVALKVGDEAGNWSEISNVVSATTPDEPYTWDIQLVDDSSLIVAHDGAIDLACDPLDGNPSFVYYDWVDGGYKYAQWDGGWEIELIDLGQQSGSTKLELAFDPQGPNSDRNPVICIGVVKLIRWNEDSQSWEVEQAFDRLRDVDFYEFDMAYDSGTGQPSVACVTRSGKRNNLTWALQLAQWNGTEWELEYVTAGSPTQNQSMGTIRDPALAFDAGGSAYIAYTDSTDDIPSVLRLARRSAGESSWQTENVDEQYDPTGNSFVNHRPPSLACDPVTGYPGITCSIYGNDRDTGDYFLHELRYASWDGDSWSVEVIDDDGQWVGWGATLAYDGDGAPCIAYNEPFQDLLRFARWETDAWNIEIVDNGHESGGNVPLVIDPAGNPSIVMQSNPSGATGPEDIFFAREL